MNVLTSPAPSTGGGSLDRDDPRYGRARRWAGAVLTALLAGLVVALAALVVANLLGYRTLIVRSGSMGETIPVGSLVVTATIPRDDIRVGDVAVVQPDDGAAARLHRVIEVTRDGDAVVVATQGDANEVPDSERTTLDPEVHILLHSVPLVGYVLDGAGSREGLLALATVGVSLVGWWGLRAMWRPRPGSAATGRAIG